MTAVSDLADRLERDVKLHRSLGMADGVSLKFNLDSADALVDLIRLAATAVTDNDRLRGVLYQARKYIRRDLDRMYTHALQDAIDAAIGPDDLGAATTSSPPSALEQGGISDRLSNFDDWGNRIRDRS